MQNNLFYLCGPHGSGKTTLGKELEKENPDILIPELFSRNIKFNTEPVYRLVLKICGRAIENFEYLEIAKKNPDKIVLGNRCIYDVLAYNRVYFQRGWTSKETYEMYDAYARDFFRNENSEPYAIVLNPGLDRVLEHLEKRWQEKGKKWREEDLEYAKLACKSYEQFQGKEKIFYINREIDLESRAEINEAYEWMKGLQNNLEHSENTKMLQDINVAEDYINLCISHQIK